MEFPKPLTIRQTHVLDNIERVAIWPRVVATKKAHTRYQLDGQDCTMQVRALLIAKLIERITGDVVRRRAQQHG